MGPAGKFWEGNKLIQSVVEKVIASLPRVLSRNKPKKDAICHLQQDNTMENRQKEGDTNNKKEKGCVLTSQFLSLCLQGHNEHDKWVFHPWQ